MATMMKCGHAANAVRVLDDGSRAPACAICAGIDGGAYEVDPNPPVLVGRLAKCSCGATRPSSLDGTLAFFEYMGPGAPNRICAHCRYVESVHRPDHPRPVTDHPYEPRSYEFDRFYCGCQGWD